MPGYFSTRRLSPIYFLFCLFLSFTFSLSLFAQNENSEEFVLSPRIGLEIDSLEAEYFNLFPEIDHVKGAVYRKDNLGNLQMLVSLASGKDTTITFSVLGTQELARYIEKYEVLPDSVKLVNWNLLPGFDPGKRNFYESYGAKVFVYSNEGKKLSAGRLLKITDQNVFVWNEKKHFQPSLIPKAVQKIPAADISKIERRQDLTGKIFGMSLGAGIGIAIMNPVSLVGADNLSLENTVYLMAGGAIVGAALGWVFDLLSISRRKYKINGDPNKFKKAKAKLQKRAKFTTIFPPELKTL
jgi:hypothetical protein